MQNSWKNYQSLLHKQFIEYATNRKPLFEKAFTAQDPAPLLLDILKKHPTSFAVRDLVFCYFDAVRNDPYCGQTLASALVRITNSADTPSYGDYPLSADFCCELGEAHLK